MDHRRGPLGELIEVRPAACSNGHAWRAPRSVFVGFLPCICDPDAAGHRTYRCAECGVIDTDPPHDWSRTPTKGSLYDE